MIMAVTGKITGNQPILNMPGKNNSVADVSFNKWTLTNSGTTDTTGIFGESSGARNFDGTNDKITGGSDLYDYMIDKLNASAGLSIITDLLTNNTTNFWVVWNYSENASSGSGTFQLLASPTPLKMLGAGSNASADSITNAVGFGSSFENNVCVIKKRTTDYEGLIYKNGVAETMTRTTTNQLATKFTNASRAFTLGFRPFATGPSWFNGKICNHKVFQKILTKNEVFIINRQKGRVNY